jgi:hypothetical protein
MRARAAQLLEPYVQFGVQPGVLQRDAGRSADGVQQFALVAQRGVMHEGGHWPRGSVDHGDGPAVRRLHVDPVTVEIRIGLELGQPVRQLQRRIPERAGQRVAQRGRR